MPYDPLYHPRSKTTPESGPKLSENGDDRRATRVARDELGLVQDPLPGLAIAQLRASGSNRASSMIIERQRHLRKRSVEGDDPFMTRIDNLQKHDAGSATGRLEEIPPDRFQQTLQFLTEYQRVYNELIAEGSPEAFPLEFSVVEHPAPCLPKYDFPPL
jgi:hypothetical protein